MLSCSLVASTPSPRYRTKECPKITKMFKRNSCETCSLLFQNLICPERDHLVIESKLKKTQPRLVKTEEKRTKVANFSRTFADMFYVFQKLQQHFYFWFYFFSSFSRRRHNLFKQLNIPGPEPTRFLGIIPQIKEKV